VRIRRNLLWISLIMVLVLCLFGVGVKTSSAVVSPAIMVVPQNTLDETLTVGETFTVSIYTDYSGSDVWGYQFSLSYDASILHIEPHNKTDTWTGDGTQDTFNTTIKPVIEDSETVYVNDVPSTFYSITYDEGRIWFFPFAIPPFGSEVRVEYQYNLVNGDLVSKDKFPSARFQAGTANNTLGKLSTTGAMFFYTDVPVNVTSGPGTLANVTFTVVDYGISDIILGDDTILIGWEDVWNEDADYDIINANYHPDHIQHGYFSNKIPGDIDGDKDVDPFDFSAFRVAYGSKGPPQVPVPDPNYDRQADLDLDGDVDPFDFSTFRVNYGRVDP
jgi:hypothetical protein